MLTLIACSIKSPRKRGLRAGLTLIEVIAGLALMGSLVVSLLWARSRFDRGWSDADRRLRAVAAADVLLTAWSERPAEEFPRTAAGTVTDGPTLRWQTHLLANQAVAQLGGKVVRLEITDDRAGVLLAVDVVVPAEAPRHE